MVADIAGNEQPNLYPLDQMTLNESLFRLCFMEKASSFQKSPRLFILDCSGSDS